jgi:hypothetical protein
MRPLRLSALGALWVALLGCGQRPESVADRFVDYYFVEMDQGRALPLASGLAHDMLERELRDVQAVRSQMRVMPADARPEVYYRRLGMRDQGERKIVSYALTLKLKGDVTYKSAQVALGRDANAWKVVFYQVGDDKPPTPEP